KRRTVIDARAQVYVAILGDYGIGGRGVVDRGREHQTVADGRRKHGERLLATLRVAVGAAVAVGGDEVVIARWQASRQDFSVGWACAPARDWHVVCLIDKRIGAGVIKEEGHGARVNGAAVAGSYRGGIIGGGAEWRGHVASW